MDDGARDRFFRVALRVMDEGACKWLFKEALSNFWRVASWYDLDELLDDGLLCYSKVLQKYPAATDAPHRMALFKRTYRNWVHDLANKRTKSVQEVLDSDISVSADADGPPMSFLASVIECPNSKMVEFDALVASAPEIVRRALALFTIEATRQSLRAAYRLRPDGSRETMNDRICRLLGVDKKFDVVGAVRQFLGGSEGVQVTVDWHCGFREITIERISGDCKYVRTECVAVQTRAALCQRSEKYVPVDKDLRGQYRPVLRLPAVAG